MNTNYHDDSSEELLSDDIENLNLDSDSDSEDSDNEIVELPIFTKEDLIKYMKQIANLKASAPITIPK